MTTVALSLPRMRAARVSRVRTKRHHFPFEGVAMYAIAFVFYIAVAAYLVFHLHYMINDALTRVDNAFNVLFTRDPHLAAIGFFWPPLPSFLDMPILLFKGWFPALATKGFAGSIEASAFSAGTMVLINSGLRWAGVVRGLRWMICLVWMINPMVIIFAAQGMGEAPFIFFFLASMLVFLRWCESRRNALLPLIGVLAGLAALCRAEALLFAAVLGVGVIVQSARNDRNWRKIETEALMYALPALLFIGLWVVTAAIIFRDPLYVIHANAVTATATPQTQANAQAYGGVVVNAWLDSVKFVLQHALVLFPAILGFVAVLGVRLLAKPGRVAGFVIIACALSFFAVDIYLTHGRGLGNYLRYQIVVIPVTYLIGVYVLRSVRGRRALISSLLALVMGAVLAMSNIFTAQTLGDPSVATEEAPLIAALSTGQPVSVGGDYGAINYGAQDVKEVLAMDSDHGLILCDSADCFPFNLNAPDPSQFVVRSDRNWEAAVHQPLVYNVEYFLVPQPVGAQASDRLNQLYPTLFQDGAGFSVLVGETKDGGWRLYRITGQTPIG